LTVNLPKHAPLITSREGTNKSLQSRFARVRGRRPYAGRSTVRRSDAAHLMAQDAWDDDFLASLNAI
jgi:hypothetical protein